jgi:hypothetical protein
MQEGQKAKLNLPVAFLRWQEVLEEEDLALEVRQGFAITIRWYLSFCRRSRTVGCFQSARDFMEKAKRESREERAEVRGRGTVSGGGPAAPKSRRAKAGGQRDLSQPHGTVSSISNAEIDPLVAGQFLFRPHSRKFAKFASNQSDLLLS